MFILKVIGQADAASVDWMRRQEVAYSTHPQILVWVLLATIFLGDWEAQETGLVSEFLGLD